MLTPKQEKFIQNIVKGMSQRQAYKDAYDVKKMTDESIDVEACKLFNDTKVSQRYQELIEQLENEAILTAKERMKWLSEVVKDIQKEDLYITVEGEMTKVGSKNADLNTKLKALDILNKMSGEYITKVEADVNSDVSINIELTDDE
jgi:phage terminase small subunit